MRKKAKSKPTSTRRAKIEDIPVKKAEARKIKGGIAKPPLHG